MATAKILVATPNFTNLFTSEVHSNHVENAVHWSKLGLKYNWLIIGRSFVHFARTQACQVALKGEYTHIFWLDDDAIVSPDLLPRYLEHDKEVVITPYFMRRPPFECGVLKSRSGNFHDHASYYNLGVKDLHQGLIEVDGGGTHAMLIKTEVLHKHGDNDSPDTCDPRLRAFVDGLSEEDRMIVDHFVGTLPDERMSLAEEDAAGLKSFFIMPKSGTEDMLFCYRLKRKGVKIWCDTDATSGHVGFAPVITEAYRAQMEKFTPGDDPVQMLQMPAWDLHAGESTRAVPSVRREGVDRSQIASLV